MSGNHYGAAFPLNGARVASSHTRCRVLLADDHELVLDMLHRLLEQEFEVVGAASDGAMLLQMARALAPDLILIDVVMPDLGGLEAGKMLRAGGSQAKLVYLTMEINPAVAAEAFAIGASAYLSKAWPAAELQRVLRLVIAGGRYLTPAIANGDIEALCAAHTAKPLFRLSPREREVLKLLVGGMPMKAVARQLGIAPRTVAFHKYRAMEVLGLRGNCELIDFAVRHGLLAGKAAWPAAHNNPDSPAG